MLFIDTEGLGDVEKGVNNDVRIFMFAMLISSHLIYNCSNVIDSGMISDLSVVTKMSERIRLSESAEHANPNSMNPKQYKVAFPAVTFLVRDFSLNLKNKEGKEITAD